MLLEITMVEFNDLMLEFFQSEKDVSQFPQITQVKELDEIREGTNLLKVYGNVFHYFEAINPKSNSGECLVSEDGFAKIGDYDAISQKLNVYLSPFYITEGIVYTCEVEQGDIYLVNMDKHDLQ